MTKQDLISENERLNRELARAIEVNRLALSALKAQTGSAYYTVGNDRFVPVPLTSEQDDYVRQEIENCRGGLDVEYGENQETVWESMNKQLLPNFAHFVVHFDFFQDQGIFINGIWGLVKVKA